jgi:dethiobiotin synthetase
MPAFFIAGTGTDIGKTFVTAGLVRILKERGRAVAALKPVASGYDKTDAGASDAGHLLSALGQLVTEDNVARICPWRFAATLSPHMAGARESRAVDYAALLDFTKKAVLEAEGALFIEGVGGVMVPLDTKHTTLDWMAEMQLPLILVTGTYLGTISHTLTAVDALTHRGLRLAALVVNESTGSTVDHQETAQSLAARVNTPVVTLPRNALTSNAGFVALEALVSG